MEIFWDEQDIIIQKDSLKPRWLNWAQGIVFHLEKSQLLTCNYDDSWTFLSKRFIFDGSEIENWSQEWSIFMRHAKTWQKEPFAFQCVNDETGTGQKMG